MDVLDRILATFVNSKIYYQKGKQIKLNYLKKLKRPFEFLQKYQLQYLKPNEKKNRGGVYLTLVKINTDQTPKTIKEDSNLHYLLQKARGLIVKHHWSVNNDRLVNIGCFTGFDPINHKRDQLKEAFVQKVATWFVAEKKTAAASISLHSNEYALDPAFVRVFVA